MNLEETDKNDTAYSDEYDRETVEECRKFVARMDKTIKENKNDPMWVLFGKVSLYFMRGERYANKFEAIRDRRKAIGEYNQKLEKARPKFNALCLVCRSDMDMVEKTMEGYGKKERVLFYFKCENCREVRKFFQDGEEYRPEPRSCPKCKATLEKKSSREGNKLIDSYTCGSCGHHEDDILDLDEKLKKPKVDKNFLKDREIFCMTEKEGKEYVSGHYHSRENWEIGGKDYINEFSTENIAIDEAVKKIKVLGVAQVQGLLTPVFQQNGLTELVFGKPEIFRGSVMLPYTAQDTLTGRDKEKAPIEVKKLIDKTLEDTNWRNTSEEITYNLGLIGGRIRGSEKEFDLRELARLRLKKSEEL